MKVEFKYLKQNDEFFLIPAVSFYKCKIELSRYVSLWFYFLQYRFVIIYFY